jgi:undecaprenyl-diphosphatase
MLTVVQIIILGIIQGAAELLPVSSSAHVVVAERLMGFDPSTPQAMFLLAMLHTGTMFAVLVYFWNRWRVSYFSSSEKFKSALIKVVAGTVATGVIGGPLILGIEKLFLHGGDVEGLSRFLPLVAAGLLLAGIVIIAAGLRRATPAASEPASGEDEPGRQVNQATAIAMGLAQAVCLPFRGLSRSGTTISVGLFSGAGRMACENFSFALAIVITPAFIGRELLRLVRAHRAEIHAGALNHLLAPGLVGLLASFLAGLLALRWLSNWLERGKWQYFGYYCLIAAGVVFALSFTLPPA